MLSVVSKMNALAAPITRISDFTTSNFISGVVDEIVRDSAIDDEDDSAELVAQRLHKRAHQKIMNYNSALARRLTPILKSFVDLRNESELRKKFAKIRARKSNQDEMDRKYCLFFNKWINSSKCVSFNFYNPALLNKISIKDAFVLTFFAMATNERRKGDNLPQIIISGVSTSGNLKIDCFDWLSTWKIFSLIL